MTQYAPYTSPVLNKPSFLNIALLTLSILFLLVPVGVTFTLPYYVKIPVLALWYVVTLLENGRFFRTHSKLVFISVAIIFLELFYLFIGKSTAASGNYYNTIIYYDIIIKAFYVISAYGEKLKYRLFRVLQVIILIVCIFNGWYGNMMQQLYDEGGVLLLINELGGCTSPTEFYNMAIFFISANFYTLINETKTKYRVLDIVALFSGFYFIFSYHTRATSLFLIILLASLIYFNRKNNKNSIGKLLGSAIAVSILGVILLFSASAFIIDILPERVAERVQAMLDLGRGTGAGIDSEYLARFTLTMNSIDTWLSSIGSFFFGIGNHLGRDYYGTVGQHAYYVDYLAKYGIIGESLIIMYIVAVSKKMQSFALPNNERFVLRIFYFIYILLGFLAKSAFAIIALGAFFYPFLAVSAIKYQQERS